MTLEEIKAAAALGATFTGDSRAASLHIEPWHLVPGVEYRFRMDMGFNHKGRFDPVNRFTFQVQHGANLNLDYIIVYEAPE